MPQYAIDIDRTKVKALGLTLTDVFAALQTYLGGYYVNDFNRFGRVYRVFVQAEGDVRSRPEDVSQLYARNATGEMVPLGTLATVKPIVGPQTISHFNLFRTAAINGEAARGRSSGQAIAAMEKTANRVLPDTMGYEWTGLVYQELKAGGQAPILFGLALVVVFLCLAALYESWSLPFTVMLVVPLAVFGALVALVAARPRERRVLPDRARDAGGPRQQERDPDRRVREAAPRRRRLGRRRRDPRRPRAPAPDPDDLARVHPRRAAARGRDRRRRRGAPLARDGRLRRHDRGDLPVARHRARLLRGGGGPARCA